MRIIFQPFVRATTLMVLVAMFLSTACAPVNLAVLAGTPVPTKTVSATPTATPSPEPTATPAVSLSPEEEKDALDQQIQDFLNKEGDYTKEKMAEMAIWGSQFCYEFGNGTDLGILRIINERSSEEDRNVAVYGYLITVTEDKNNNIFLTMGFDGKDGNRIVTELMVFGSSYDYYHNLPDGDPDKDRLKFAFMLEGGLHLDDKSSVKFYATSSDEIYKNLVSLEGKKVAADIRVKKVNTSGMDGGKKTIWNQSNNRLHYTYNLISKLANNGIDTSAIGSSGKDISLIDNGDDLSEIDLNAVPIITDIRFRENG